jgi:DNA-binding transcriptional LysR family regulator
VVSTYVLPAILERFHALHPGVQLIVRTGHSEEILELVLREQVQVGLLRDLEHPDITATPLYDDELVLVTPPRHAFASRDEVELVEIAAEDLVLFDRTSSYHELTSALFRSAGVLPRAPMELDNIESAKKMVQQGLGVALLPLIAVAGELAAGTLGTVRIAGTPPLARRVVAIRRRDAGAPAGAVAAFLAIAHQLAGPSPVPAA